MTGAVTDVITSSRGARVRAARLLVRRSWREKQRAFLAEGPQSVREALRRPGVLRELFVTAEAAARHSELVGQAAADRVAVHQVSTEIMAELCQTVHPQGLLAVCRFLDVALADLTAGQPRLVAVLASVRDPGNAGTVLRTADAAGAGGVIFAADSVDPYNAKCVRSAAGSLFHVPVVTGVPLPAAAAALRDAGLRLLAADGRAERRLDELAADGQLGAGTAWLFGNEAWGLPAELASLADEKIAVPIYGQAESLNLAAAAAVCLYASALAQARPGQCPGANS
ncbi:MAG: TrmH family RNA methyltransferase [Streptosporangiaceae bacterium]